MRLLGKEHGRKGGDVVLNVTAMVDMMMVLVIFLVMNFNASGEMAFLSHDMRMPGAENGDEITRVPIIAISWCEPPEPSAGKPSEPKKCVPGTSQLYFEGEPIVQDLGASSGDPNPRIEELEKKLVDERQRYERIAPDRKPKNPEEDPTTTVNVQVDRRVEFSLLKRVLSTCEQSGFGRIRLAVGNAGKAKAAPTE
jgi:biopolymer transport protein ExbD